MQCLSVWNWVTSLSIIVSGSFSLHEDFIIYFFLTSKNIPLSKSTTFSLLTHELIGVLTVFQFLALMKRAAINNGEYLCGPLDICLRVL